MLPIGPLMKEHRLIERMIALLAHHLEHIKRTGDADVGFIDHALDFIRTYADRCHHGKEEDILFRALGSKTLSPEHEDTLAGLIHDHNTARKTVAALVEARNRYGNGDPDALDDIARRIESLVTLYPAHIETEDKHFFIPVMDYFSDDEKNAMVQQGNAFDQTLIHQKYRDLVQALETPPNPRTAGPDQSSTL